MAGGPDRKRQRQQRDDEGRPDKGQPADELPSDAGGARSGSFRVKELHRVGASSAAGCVWRIGRAGGPTTTVWGGTLL